MAIQETTKLYQHKTHSLTNWEEYPIVLCVKCWIYVYLYVVHGESGLPWWLDGKESACSAGDLGSIPGSGRSPAEGNGYPLQYFCLENSMDRGAWWATVPRVTQSQIWLSDQHLHFHFTFTHMTNSHVQLFATLWTVAHQAPLSMGSSRQEYWSGLSFPSPGDLPNPGIEPMCLMSPALADRFFTTSPYFCITSS